jgi:hypothetical protein
MFSFGERLVIIILNALSLLPIFKYFVSIDVEERREERRYERELRRFLSEIERLRFQIVDDEEIIRDTKDALRRRRQKLRKFEKYMKQIEAISASNTKLFLKSHSSKDQFNINHDECCICLSLFEEGDILNITKCSHVYHFSCLSQWKKKQMSCPYCRCEIA